MESQLVLLNAWPNTACNRCIHARQSMAAGERRSAGNEATVLVVVVYA